MPLKGTMKPMALVDTLSFVQLVSVERTMGSRRSSGGMQKFSFSSSASLAILPFAVSLGEPSLPTPRSHP